MLDEFRALDVCDQELGLERSVKLCENLLRAFRFHAQDDPVRIKKILHGGSLPQKLGIGCHVKLDISFAVVVDGLLDPFAGLNRNCTLVHDQAVRIHGSSNLS